MSDREEELINEFEEAYQRQDHVRLAEMIRFIRSEVQRDPGLADRIPTKELFELLHAEDGTLAEEIRWLLGDLLERVDVASVLSTFGPTLETALRPDNRKEVLHLGLDFMSKAVAGKNSEGSLSTVQWEMLIRLLSHEDVSVADRAANRGLRDHLTKEIGRLDCDKGTGMSDTIRVRLIALRIRMRVSGGGWGEVKQLLEEAVGADDSLLLMNALQIVQEECTSDKTIEECHAVGTILRIKELVEHEALEGFLVAKAVTTLAAIFRTTSPVIMTVFNDIKPLEIIKRLLDANDSSLLAAALLLLGVLCANEAIPDDALKTPLECPTMYQLMLDSDPQIQEAFQATVALVFGPAPRELQLVFYHHLSAAIATHPISLLITRAPSTLSKDLKSSTYDALSALLRHDWIVEDALATTGLVNFLLDRSSDQSMLGLQQKYDLIKQLSDMPAVGDAIKGQLRAYIAQGVVHSRAAPSLATQNR